MKYMLTLALSLMLMGAQAQNSKAGAQYSDEDLQKYAVTMDSIQGMQQTLQQIVAEQVQNSTSISVQRYNELFRMADNKEQLTSAGATEAEIDFLTHLSDLRTWNIERINSVYQDLAKEYVGLTAFNGIRKALENDANLKARYEAISRQVAGGEGQ